MRRAATIAVCLLALGGCSSIEDIGGGEAVIRMAPWVRALLIAVPAVLVLGCAWLARFKGPLRILGPVMAAGVLLFSGLLVPGIYLDQVMITRRGIVQKTGFWFAPTVKGFDYHEVREVKIVRREGRDHFYNAWLVLRTDGSAHELDPGDLWDFNEAEVLTRLQGHGVVVRDAR